MDRAWGQWKELEQVMAESMARSQRSLGVHADANQEDEKPTHVLLVIRHKTVRQAMAFALAEEGMTIVADLDSVNEARPYLPLADVIVLELELRDGNGLHLIQSIRADGLQGRTLGLALDDRQKDQALQAGVTAVLHQSVSLNVFVETVQGLASRAGQSNGVELPGTGSYVESEDLCDSAVDPIQPLTKREHDILEALIEGLGDKQIARQLGIKTRTAETHITNICRKLGAKSRLQVLVIAHRSGLINLAQKPDSR